MEWINRALEKYGQNKECYTLPTYSSHSVTNHVSDPVTWKPWILSLKHSSHPCPPPPAFSYKTGRMCEFSV